MDALKKAGAVKERIPDLPSDLALSGIYREVLPVLPSDDGPDDNGGGRTCAKASCGNPFMRPTYPRRTRAKARRLHSFPRFGYGNDVTALVSFSDTGEPALEGGGGRLDGFLSKGDSNATAAVQSDVSQFVDSEVPVLSNKEYNKQDANDYVRGIAAAGILIVAIYLVWGLGLLSLRMGRMDCCFRLCRGCDRRRRKKKRGKALADSADDEGDGDGSDDEASAGGGGCCLFACHETLAAKGGCCARNICCGWMAGKPPQYPTRESLARERELREKSLVPKSVRKAGSGVHKAGSGAQRAGMAASGAVQGAASQAGSVLVRKKDSADGQQEADDAAVVEAETGMPAMDEDGTNEPADAPPTPIDDAYLRQRQKNARRTMIGLRITFLISATLVIIFSIVLLVKGWQGVNGVVDGTKDTVRIIEDRLQVMMTDIERYVEVNQDLKVQRDEFLENATSQISEVGSETDAAGRLGWCPASAREDGKVDITVSLAQLLLRGNLIKLAFVEEAVDAAKGVAGQVGTLVEGATDAVQGVAGGANASGIAADAKEQGAAIVETVADAAGGTKDGAKRDLVNVNTTNVKEQAGSLVENAANTVQNVAEGVKEQGASVVEGASDVFVDFVGGDDSAKATAAVKEVGVTVITFLDELPAVQNVLSKVLGLKDVIAEGLDGEGRIAAVVAKLKERVKAVVSRVSDEFLDSEEGEDRQRFLQTSGLPSLRETVVEKDGINYTILTLVDDVEGPAELMGDRLIFRGYNLTELFTAEVTVTLDIPGLVDTITEHLNSTSNFFEDIFSKLYTGAEKVHAQSQSAQETLDSILPYYYVAVVFVCFIILLTLFFMLGVVLAWKNKQHRLFRLTNDRILCPIFLLCGLLMWVFTTVFLALGVTTGDFCFETPNNQVNQILDQTLRQTSGIAFNFAYYYVNSCPLGYQPKVMSVAFKALTLARTGIGQFFALVSSFGSGPLSRACGVEVDSSVDALQALAGAVREHLAAASEVVLSLASVLLCKSIAPLYTALVYDLICSDFLNLVAPLLWSMFIISICSMIMITTRVAWHELVEDEGTGDPHEDEKDGSEDGAALGEEEVGDPGKDLQ